jgi:hypothetical protein
VHGYVQSFLRRMAEELPHVDLVLRELVTADQAGVGLAIVPESARALHAGAAAQVAPFFALPCGRWREPWGWFHPWSGDLRVTPRQTRGLQRSAWRK